MKLYIFPMALLFGLESTLPACAQLFQIAAPVFSKSISTDGSYTPLEPAVDGRISRARLHQGEICFSFTVMGGEATIRHLEENQSLGVFVVILGGDRSQTIAGLGIDRQRWENNKEAWTSQFNKDGYFTFRTYMKTRDTFREIVELQIRDDKRNVIRPIAYSASYKASVAILP